MTILSRLVDPEPRILFISIKLLMQFELRVNYKSFNDMQLHKISLVIKYYYFKRQNIWIIKLMKVLKIRYTNDK